MSKRPEIFRSLIGLEVPEFDKAYGKIEANYMKYEERRLSKGPRKNRVGWGRAPVQAQPQGQAAGVLTTCST
ncbi:MAG: hypothetical protein QXH07_05610 [Thermoplasmata archaeon]